VITAVRIRLRGVLSGFWAVPGLVAAALAGLALLLIQVDQGAAGRGGRIFLYGGDAAAARDVLSTLAGSMITVAGLTLSLLIVTLTLTSSQFTPRAIKNLLADRVNQIVAGAFVGTVGYCLLVLRVVRADTGRPGDTGFVPALSVTVAIGLGIGALGLLIVFIHHSGQAIKVEQIAARIGAQTLAAADRRYPQWPAEPNLGQGQQPAPVPAEEPALCRSGRAGFVQAVALAALIKALAGPAARVELLVTPGDFVTPEQPLVAVWPADALDRVRHRAVRRAVTVNAERDVHQDVGFGIRQLVDIALRAISPGINDPTTAVSCIGYLAAILERLAAREAPAPEHVVAEQRLVLVAPRPDFTVLLEDAVLELSRYGRGDPRVTGALLDALRVTAAACRGDAAPDRLRVTIDLAREITGAALSEAATDRDRSLLTGRLRGVEQAAEGRPAPVLQHGGRP
jgi:uncharacterized membrane protein